LNGKYNRRPGPGRASYQILADSKRLAFALRKRLPEGNVRRAFGEKAGRFSRTCSGYGKAASGIPGAAL
ncbi:MAG: hypothetical protein MR009_05145, partial [Sutterellaceae bacterium]|nr:hypothetical protein [Sutterellaceae bacterium]